MDDRCNETTIRESIKTRRSQSNSVPVKNILGCGINKRFNILTTWNCLTFFVLLLFCFATSGYAIDVTLKWTPNNEPNLAGYTVFYRQEGQSYDYTNPYWETTDSSCTIYDLDETQTYYFVVKSVSIEGFQSDNSNEVCLEAGTTTSD